MKPEDLLRKMSKNPPQLDDEDEDENAGEAKQEDEENEE